MIISIFNSTDVMVRISTDISLYVSQLNQSLQWRKQKDPLSHKLEGKDQVLKLSSDHHTWLICNYTHRHTHTHMHHTCIHTYIHTDLDIYKHTFSCLKIQENTKKINVITYLKSLKVSLRYCQSKHISFMSWLYFMSKQ